MITSIRHTGVVVRDLKNSVNFYSALGFKVKSKSIEEGEFIDQVTGLEKVKLEWVKLNASDGNLIELLHYHSHPQIKNIINQKSNQLGCSHIAFGVESIENTCKMIQKMGGDVVNKPSLSIDGKALVAYCHDLEGVLLEIVEVINGS
jgi:predicted enzyme related to lactoylglutathione lyase